MKYLILILLVMNVAFADAQTVTTVILVRHAEKATDDPKDPDLSDAGKQRAQHLAQVLRKTKVDAIYSTPYKRTRNTAAPLAESKGLSVLTYDPSKKEELDLMVQKFAGGTIVVVGHSNTIPAFANHLTGKTDFQNFNDNEYDNLLVISVVDSGKISKTVWLVY
ncbi:MAG: histidine phosphatase family protein [Cytophagales bacterium]|nr:histidine phosphatase family protein [Cytophagales bacterium]